MTDNNSQSINSSHSQENLFVKTIALKQAGLKSGEHLFQKEETADG
jgi:hypothetical protein